MHTTTVGQPGIIRMLLMRCADVTLQNNLGDNALHTLFYAAGLSEEHFISIARSLMKAGLSPNVMNHEGHSALDLAMATNQEVSMGRDCCLLGFNFYCLFISGVVLRIILVLLLQATSSYFAVAHWYKLLCLKAFQPQVIYSLLWLIYCFLFYHELFSCCEYYLYILFLFLF